MPAETVLELRDIVKTFPGVRALDGAKFDLRAGECHALVGENGAGKSTLMNIIAGVYRPDAGRILLAGRDAINTWLSAGQLTAFDRTVGKVQLATLPAGQPGVAI